MRFPPNVAENPRSQTAVGHDQAQRKFTTTGTIKPCTGRTKEPALAKRCRAKAPQALASAGQLAAGRAKGCRS
ncbi:MAG TPA: hypothetical protein VGN12_25565 [Pirellulales bacterium]